MPSSKHTTPTEGSTTMQTTITRNGTVLSAPAYTLLDWARARCNILAEEGASAAFMRGFLDAARFSVPDVNLFAGEPFNAADYHEGFGLCRYTTGPIDREEFAA
jgi:hypothetical protein